MRWPVVMVLLVVAGVIGWLQWSSSRAQPFVVSGFIEADQIRVGSRVGGRVAEVIAQEGQRVQVGAVLYRIDPFNLREELAGADARFAAAQSEHARLKAGFRVEEVEQARARRDQAAAAYDKLKSGPRPREIEIGKSKLALAAANLDLAESEHGRVTRLEKESSAARIELDRVIRSLKAAQAEKAAAEQELALLEEGYRAEDVAAAKAVLAEAEQALALMTAGYRREDVARAAAEADAAAANVAAIKTQLSELTVSSPCGCVVEAIELRPGDLVGSNAPSVSLLDVSRLWVRSYVPESRLGSVKLGATVPVRVDSYPAERFPGRISFIATEAEFAPRNVQTPEERSKQVFRIKVTLESGVERLRVGMGADVMFDEAARP